MVIRRYIYFLILLIPTPLASVLFCSSIPTFFVHFKKCICIIGVELEVEGMRYIEMHHGLATYVLGPPPSRGGDCELEGGVNACHIEYVYESRDSHVRGTE